MNQSSLDALIEMATDRRDNAATRLGSLQGERARAQHQLEALVEYRREYNERLAQAMANGLSMHRLDNDQRFLATLDAAIDQQERIVAASEDRVSEGQSAWRESQRRLQSFDTLADRQRTREARQQARREQTDNDEAAGRQARRAIH